MRAKIKFKYPHEANQIIRPNFKAAGKKFVHELASEVQGGDDFCYTVIHAGTIEGKIRARRKRAAKYKQRKSLPIATPAGPTNSE